MANPYKAWGTEACATFEAADVPVWARTTYMLGRYTGQRRGDLLRMARSHYDGRCILVASQEKTAARVVIPVHWRLKQYLDDLPRDALLFITRPSGEAWDKRNFTKTLRAVLDRIGLKGSHLHGVIQRPLHSPKQVAARKRSRPLQATNRRHRWPFTSPRPARRAWPRARLPSSSEQEQNAKLANHPAGVANRMVVSARKSLT